VNNAGVMVIDKFMNFSDENLNKLITLNLHAQLLLTKKIIPMLLKSDNPHIVFMSSMSAKNRIVGDGLCCHQSGNHAIYTCIAE
jgi:NADP-dependent 3-hydroxy acid dehydrogenase YdfG